MGGGTGYTFVVIWQAGDVVWRPARVPDGIVLSPALPAVWAEGVAHRLAEPPRMDPERARDRTRRLIRTLAALGVEPGEPPFRPPPVTGELPWHPDELRQHTFGRRFLGRELHGRMLRRRRLPFGDVRPAGEWPALVDSLFSLQKQGWGRVLPAVVWRENGFQCARCYGRRFAAWPCRRCGSSRCLECETCRSLGVVRGCDIVFEGPVPGATLPHGGSPVRRVKIRGTMPPLSLAQRGAATELLEFLAGRRREALLWAACGAGKTEVAFAAIRTVLEGGGRVLFAVPRRDVVAELGVRLAGYAYPYPVETAYGGAVVNGSPGAAAGGRGGTADSSGGTGEDDDGCWESARPWESSLPPLVVATTHQCVRLGAAFDLVVLDEVDAFPYRVEPFLRQALLATLAPGGKLVTMTATPEAGHLRRARRGGVQLITIPARHHGHPLPVPRWIRDADPGRWSRGPLGVFAGRKPLHVPVLRAIAACVNRGPTLVFVPTVAQAEHVGALFQDSRLREVLQGGNAGWIHSRDPDRDRKLAAFREGRKRLLVATTVLERGITVPAAQVVVLFADDERVFDERTLVQMAGRAGRSTEHPDGFVYYVGRRRTKAMARAVAQIREMNARAARAGYLKEGV